MRFLLRAFWTAGAVSLLSFLVLLGAFFHFKNYIHSPASSTPREMIFPIPKGASFKTTLARLEKSDLVGNAFYFDLLARAKGKRGSLKAGEYALDTGMTPLHILEMITEGKCLQLTLTVPEGFNMVEIARRAQELGVGAADEFLRIARDPKVLDRHAVKADSLEGYLFPDTYQFAKGSGLDVVVDMMAGNFVKKVRTEEISREIEGSGFSFHEILTLASLIEKETALVEEKELISAVFHNRLKKKMLLQCDPTVIYALKDFDGNIRKKDLQTDSPYNTYRYRGLPPGPIANPGLGSILAALHPAPIDALYFVSKKDGSHHFSSTLEEHNQAVRKFQLNKRS